MTPKIKASSELPVASVTILTPLTAPITRRGFVKMGGALLVSLSIPAGLSLHAAQSPTSLDPSVLASWLEIHSDNTILAHTGRTETGTGMSAYYAQTIAEELCVRPETISLVLGDTDRTPDGGASAGFLDGMANVRKVAPTRTRRCWAWPRRNLVFPSPSLPSPMPSSRAAAKASVTASSSKASNSI